MATKKHISSVRRAAGARGGAAGIGKAKARSTDQARAAGAAGAAKRWFNHVRKWPKKVATIK